MNEGFAAGRYQVWEWACSRRGRRIQHRWRLTCRFREQARSHWGSSVNEGFAAGRDQGWEWACSRRGRRIQHQCRLSGRLREQARSHWDRICSEVMRCMHILISNPDRIP
ncbi:hypothetical protein FHG55_13925 [Pseudomonas jessenii]|uniref:Uncharacterized protein n=1 Tax=Pseudomonas jessenii TaxID=77298 RepID=A0A5C4KXD1_PSEJE|nr:hypothetical protein FHG55_13925 [Pseudomonas jessenii]